VKRYTEMGLVDELYNNEIGLEENSNRDKIENRNSGNYRNHRGLFSKLLGSALLSMALVFPASGCASKMIYLRPSDVRQYNLTPEEIKNLQFYTDEELILKRVVFEKSDRHASGRLVTEYGKLYEVVEIKPDTPGVAIHVSPDRMILDMSFEPNYSIQFRPGLGAWSDLYTITVSRRSGSLKFQSYGRFEYEMNGTPQLMVKKKDITQIETKRRVVPGRRLEAKQTEPQKPETIEKGVSEAKKNQQHRDRGVVSVMTWPPPNFEISQDPQPGCEMPFGGRIGFSWQVVPEASSYRLFVKNVEGAFPSLDVSVHKPNYIWNQCGSYIVNKQRLGWTWKVQVIYKNGEEGGWSKEQTFSYKPLTPKQWEWIKNHPNP